MKTLSIIIVLALFVFVKCTSCTESITSFSSDEGEDIFESDSCDRFHMLSVGNVMGREQFYLKYGEPDRIKHTDHFVYMRYTCEDSTILIKCSKMDFNAHRIAIWEITKN